MIRRRWIRARWPGGLPAVAAGLRREAFTDSTPEGFLIDKMRDEFVEGRFVVRRDDVELLIDPFGRETASQRLRFEQTRFVIWGGILGLELIEPPRNMSLFREAMSRVCNFEVAFSAIDIDVLRWCSNIELIMGEKITVSSLQFGSWQAEEDILATALLTSRGDVRNAVDGIVRGKPHIVDKIKLSTPSGIKLVLSRSAAASFGRTQLDKTVAAARLSLASALGI